MVICCPCRVNSLYTCWFFLSFSPNGFTNVIFVADKDKSLERVEDRNKRREKKMKQNLTERWDLELHVKSTGKCNFKEHSLEKNKTNKA